jgi:hypothetical protein
MKYYFLTFLFLFITLYIKAELKYSIPQSPWGEELGNHRTVVIIEKPSEVVRLNYLWRRHDKNPETRHLMIINKETGEKIENILRLNITNEECDILFGPVEKSGIYYFYYLPYSPVENEYHSGKYLEKEKTPNEEWLKNINITGTPKVISDYQQADVIEIQARSEFHSFFPMEVIATKDELKKYIKKYDEPYLVFPEDRSLPIRMLDALPYVWIQEKPGRDFLGTALQNEYYAMQLGVYASKSSLEDLKIEFSDLTTDSGELIHASLITCFNTHGVDINGEPFVLKVNVPQGKIQPMWIGIDIGKNVKPGIYEGTFTVKPNNQKEKQVKIKLQVKDQISADRGDGEPWRHSRLRWLNSTIGIDDEPVTPYSAIEVNYKTIFCLGRQILLNEFGFPEQVKAWDNEVLALPVKFTLESENRILGLKPVKFNYTKQKNGIVCWEAISENDKIELVVKGEIEFDGRMSYKCKVRSKQQIHLQDIRLEIPFKKELATYMFGMGRMGGYTPEFHKSRWRSDEDSFWLGNSDGGIHCELRGGSYHGPLLNLYQPNHPSSWYNGVNGGFRIDSDGSVTTATAYSGYRDMPSGSEVDYEFALIITPVKKYNPNDQFNYRYDHTPYPGEEVVLNGGNVMNVHHANEYNPFINYPFVANEKLKSLVEKWHEKDWKVKIYYTVRELSNYITEIWALRSLGFEVLADGPGGGYQWLQEHLVDNYRYQWYTHLGNGIVDAAILNSGESRWYNYYLEGLAWLLKEIDIDGLYLDDFSYDRRILKRVRKIMEEIKPQKCHIDVHSNTAFSHGPANQYLEIYPYIDRTWYGEGFNFDLMPADFWFSEVSGIPFGVVNELLLHRSINKGRRGMIYAMVPRADWGMWRFWKEFGITESKMVGYWEERVPVKTNNKNVYATTYIKNDKALIVLGNWLNESIKINLNIDWDLLGLQKNSITSLVPEIQNYQDKTFIKIDEPIDIDSKGVKFIIVSKK